MIDFKVKRAEDCVLIDTKGWITDGTGISKHRMSGRIIPTFINKALDVYPVTRGLKSIVNNGDTILISRIASDISQYRKFGVREGDERYYHCPIMQVLGIFENEEISLSSLKMCTDKVLIEKIDMTSKGIILPETNTMIGKVVKVGTHKFDKDWNILPLCSKVGDTVLVRDNVSTEIYLKEGKYYATEDSMIVGIFENEKFDLNHLNVCNDYVIMNPYIPEFLNSMLVTPTLDFENEDISEIYNRDLFKVLKVDKKVDRVLENDILLIDRNLTNYVYLGLEKYYVLNGIDNISSKIIKGEKND